MVPIAESEDPRALERWTFALEAMRIPFTLTPSGDESEAVVVWVDREHAARAHRAVVELDIEHATAGAPRPPAAPSEPAHAAGAIPWAVALTWLLMLSMLAQVYLPTWEDHGILDAAAFHRGEWYRAVTAITLHSDLVHLAANSAFLLIFGIATIRHLGAGLVAAVGVGSGALANVTSAVVHGDDFRSLGASGATFALLGLAAALAAHRRPTQATVRWLPAVGAALGLLAFTGVAPRTDLVAHGAGLALGFVCGLGAPVLERLGERRTARVKLAAGWATALVVALAWALALRG